MALLVTLLVYLFYALLLWSLLRYGPPVPFLGPMSFPVALAVVAVARVLILEDWLGVRTLFAALAVH